MADWQQLLNKVEKAEKVFDKILDLDRDGLVVGFDKRAEFNRLAERNKLICNKLRTKEFTVAVVGLEKAGKSTLGNALLHLVVLPEYTERCTYTTTEIRAGASNTGVITFYSYEEFNNDFRKMQERVKCPDIVDYYAFDLASFNRYWNSVAEKDYDFYVAHNGKTVEDIKMVAENKNLLKGLLGMAPRKYDEAGLQGDDFQRFITGINGFDEKNVVIRSAHPYAVKKVNITSNNLGDMNNIVLYDVPGFNSPTALHKKQTEEMLKAADAIILVTNVGETPNLDGNQLDMLRKGKDADGIKLSEKAFIFGNKIDKAANRRVAEDNMAVLRNDAVNKYMIATSNHIVYGSAKAYLHKDGLYSSDDIRRGIMNIGSELEEWGMSNGIDTLVSKMKEYYDNDRMLVIEKRVNKNLEEAEDFMRSLLDGYSGESAVDYSILKRATLEMSERVALFYQEAKKVLESNNEEIRESDPPMFSSVIRDDIKKIYAELPYDSPKIEEIRLSLQALTGGNFLADAIEPKLRLVLKNEFQDEIIKRVAEATVEKEQDIYNKLVEKFLETVGVDKSSIYYDELRNSVHDEFMNVMEEHSCEKCRFDTLIKRFITTINEVIIGTKFGAVDRVNVLKDSSSLPEIISLLSFYPSKDDNGSWFDPKLIEKKFAEILAHEGLDEDKKSAEEAKWENKLNEVFKEHADEINSGVKLVISLLPVSKWARILAVTGAKYDKIERELERLFYHRNWSTFNDKEKEREIERCIKKVRDESATENNGEKTQSLADILDVLHKRGVDKRNMVVISGDTSKVNVDVKNNMVDIINTDIRILQDITLNAVIKAIGLEKAFISVITANIEAIRDNVKNNSMNDWINDNVEKVYEQGIIEMNSSFLDNAARKNIIESIEKVLPELSA